MTLRRSELVVGYPAVANDPIELAAHYVDGLGDAARCGTDVHAERARLEVRDPIRIHRVRQTPALPHLLEQSRRHAATEGLAQDGEGIAVGIIARDGARAHEQVNLHDVLGPGRASTGRSDG